MHDRYRPKIIRGGEAPPQQESRAIGVWVLAATLVLVNSAASAGESAFAYVYTTDLLPQGAKEIEQWVTVRHQQIGGSFDQIEGRTAFEYGLADNLQVAFYANYAWTHAFQNGPFGATTPGEPFADFAADPNLPFNQTRFEPNSQTLEIRPIFERQDGRLYLSINPDLGLAIKGPDAGSAPEFEPNIKAGWDLTRRIAAGMEYYAETGPVKHFNPLSEQHHILFPALDLSVSPDWELNFGIGKGLTSASEHWIVKSIVGYRFKH